MKTDRDLAEAIVGALAEVGPEGHVWRLRPHELTGSRVTAFNRLDADADGRLTNEEIEQALAQVPSEDLEALRARVEAVHAQLGLRPWLRRGVLGLTAMSVLLVGWLYARAAFAGTWGDGETLEVVLALLVPAGIGLVGVGLHGSLLLMRRRALGRTLEGVARAHGLGLESRVLAAHARKVLGTERLPGKLGRLPLDGRVAVGMAIDRATRRVAVARWLDEASSWAGSLAAIGLLLALMATTGIWNKHGHWTPPDPALARGALVGALACALVAGCLSGLGRWWLRALRERFARELEDC